MLKRLIVIIFVGSLTLQFSEGEGPTLPSHYKQNYTEKISYWLVKKGTTNGTVYSDMESKRERVDKKNGHYDKLCGSVYLTQNTPCTHFVNDGKRYLHFPEKNYCCMCCNESQGCGMTNNDFMTKGTFVKEYEDNGITYEVWQNGGVEMTFLKENKILAFMNQKYEEWSFDTKSLTMDFDLRMLDLPDICDEKKKCGIFSKCNSKTVNVKEI